jgi:hypothetical protein
MENQEEINSAQNGPINKPLQEEQNEDQTEFENPNVDPGFESSDENKLTGREDKRSGNIDSNKSISEMREEFEQKQNDATNLGNDREHGSYNPKNI